MSLMEKLALSAVDVDIRDNSEKLNTPLHWAVSFSNKEAIKFLIGDYKLDTCLKDKP